MAPGDIVYARPAADVEPVHYQLGPKDSSSWVSSNDPPSLLVAVVDDVSLILTARGRTGWIETRHLVQR